ncbi:MAG: ribosome small subunit-dependent GTPase A [Bacillota bacterium]|nr:ribosome small subunit-dependent GTPase A [Bacillota bacterium]
MITGTVLKAYGGYYYVQAGDTIYTCRLRGRVKARGPVLPGDRVEMDVLPDGNGLIARVAPRSSELVRPSVANVDQVAVVTSFHEPEPVSQLVNRLLLQAEARNLGALVVVNKTDLAGPGERDAPWIEGLRLAGYPVLLTSTVTGEGLTGLKAALAGRLSVLAGPSGVGKSSILRHLLSEPDAARVKTGEVSRKLGGGRHTTRHAEIFPLPSGGWVVDAPGFSRLYLPRLSREELASCFPEMRPFIGHCRFNGCLHDQEPDCAVKDGVRNGFIAAQRYEDYLAFLREVAESERGFPK